MILPMIASIFLIIAIVCFLNLTPQQITQDLSSVVSKKPNIRDRARALRAGKKKKGLGAKLEYLQSALKACGKEGMFAFVCSSALVLFAVGAVVAVLINNVFLIPALSVAFAMIPFVYVRNIINIYENGIVTDMIADLPDNAVGCKFDYSPNIDFLNAQIENWSENNIVFLGLFHTHFSGSKNLSDADVEYIKAIMNASKGIIEYLYFPLFTLPNNELTVYKAYFNDADISVDKDELIIV